MSRAMMYRRSLTYRASFQAKNAFSGVAIGKALASRRGGSGVVNRARTTALYASRCMTARRRSFARTFEAKSGMLRAAPSLKPPRSLFRSDAGLRHRGAFRGSARDRDVRSRGLLAPPRARRVRARAAVAGAQSRQQFDRGPGSRAAMDR